MVPEPQHPGRILVVDDEEPVAKLLQEWLVDEGYEVHYALHFDAVRDFLEKETFDLVTLDIMMPEVDGLQILGWLREHYPDVGAIMATAIGNLDAVLEAMRGGAINYLLKPFHMDLVTEEIGRGMERQRLIAENRAYQRELEQKVAERTRSLQEAHAALQTAHARLEHQMRELEGRDRLVSFQMAAHTLEEAYTEVLEVVKQVLGVPQAVLYRPNAQEDRLEPVAAMGGSAPGRMEDPEQRGEWPAFAVDERTVVVQAFGERMLRRGRGREAAVPLLYREEVWGVLQVQWPAEEGDDEACNTLWRLGGEAALVLQGAMVAEELEGDVLSWQELENLQ